MLVINFDFFFKRENGIIIAIVKFPFINMESLTILSYRLY